MRKFLLIVVFFISSTMLFAGGKMLRIVSLTPSVTKQLILLGMKKNIVGCTEYCPIAQDPSVKVAIVASVVKANVEKILVLKPDVVFASSLVEDNIISKLMQLNIKVVRYEYPVSYKDICSQFLNTAKIVGKVKTAQSIINKLEAKKAAVVLKVKNKPKKKVFVEIGAKPLFTAIDNTFINDFIIFSGAENIAKGVKNGAYSRETVLKQNPDVIIIVTMGIVGEEEKKTWESYRSIKAVKNKKVFVLDSYKVCSPTPVEFIEMLEEISKLIHS